MAHVRLISAVWIKLCGLPYQSNVLDHWKENLCSDDDFS